MERERDIQYYVTSLAAQPSDDLRPFRYKALVGRSTPLDCAHMHTLLTAVKSQAQHAVTRQRRDQTFAACAHVNSTAMLLA
jgi:hypothetical protein